MATEFIDVVCPNCEENIKVPMNEFVDVVENPEYKEQIIEGEFFLNRCGNCGDHVLVEYPLMYMDPDKKLNVYMAPAHEEDLLDQLNSLDVPGADLDSESQFRLASNGLNLMEKILIFERGRDDRVLELYKFIIWEDVKEQWDDLEQGDLLFMFDDEEDYFVIWTSDNGNDEKLTIPIDDEIYSELEENYFEALSIPPGKYAEVDQEWISERFER